MSAFRCPTAAMWVGFIPKKNSSLGHIVLSCLSSCTLTLGQNGDHDSSEAEFWLKRSRNCAWRELLEDCPLERSKETRNSRSRTLLGTKIEFRWRDAMEAVNTCQYQTNALTLAPKIQLKG
jgi:hypothetical protein